VIQSTGTGSIYPLPRSPHPIYTLCVHRVQFSRARRSAARAQKAFSQSNSGLGTGTPKDAAARTEKVIKTVKRRRKQRYHRLREMMQSSSDDAHNHGGRGEGGIDEIICPVCLETVFGDPDVAEAHVDACLIHAMSRAHEEAEIDVGGPSRTRVTDGTNLTGPVASQALDTILTLNLHSTSQLQVSTLGTQITKTSKMKLTSTGTTKRFSAGRSSQRLISCPHRGP